MKPTLHGLMVLAGSVVGQTRYFIQNPKYLKLCSFSHTMSVYVANELLSFFDENRSLPCLCCYLENINGKNDKEDMGSCEENPINEYSQKELGSVSPQLSLIIVFMLIVLRTQSQLKCCFVDLEKSTRKLQTINTFRYWASL
jgi:hypothetical protein